MKDRYFRIEPQEWRDKATPVDEAEAIAILSGRVDELAIGPGDHAAYYRGGSIIVTPESGHWVLLGRDNKRLAAVSWSIYAPQVVLSTAREILNDTLTHEHAVVLK